MADNQDDLDNQVKDFVINTIDKDWGCIDDVMIIDNRFTGGMLICILIYDPVGVVTDIN
ncbi:MAG: hypothetical protein E6053_03045 [Finegoldia magna]|nr:hypothetical protein [Finegoldia magna]MDU5526434.1 hypothetical protein [Finegoldia magna]